MSLGWQVAHWFEHLLCHGPGDLEGEPIELDDELLGFVLNCYALDPETGRRLVDTATLSRPKGRAKSELAGMVACGEALGPVRFERWASGGEVSWWGYRYSPGEPVGRSVRSPFIRCLATEESQAGNTYDNVEVMLTVGPIADRVDGVDVGKTRTFLPGSGEIRPSTAGAASKDGGKETFAVADEVHLYVLPEHRQMHDMVDRNLRKRKIAQPWMLKTTTMFRPGQGSIAEDDATHVEHIVAGKVRNRGTLYDHRTATPLTDREWQSDRKLSEALTVGYGDAAKWMNVDAIVDYIRKPSTLKADALRYWCNLPAASDDDLVELAVWDVLDRTRAELWPDHLPLTAGDVIAVGFDGSDTTDRTALYACRWPDWTLFELGVWARPEGAADWSVPRLAVADAVAHAFSMYRVARMFYDPPRWQTEGDTWRAEYGEKVVVRFPTYSDTKMGPAVERFVTATRGGSHGHDGGTYLRSAIANAVKTRTRHGFRIDKRSAGLHIDEAVAAILAEHALAEAVAAGDVTPDYSPAAVPTSPSPADGDIYRDRTRLDLGPTGRRR